MLQYSRNLERTYDLDLSAQVEWIGVHQNDKFSMAVDSLLEINETDRKRARYLLDLKPDKFIQSELQEMIRSEQKVEIEAIYNSSGDPLRLSKFISYKIEAYYKAKCQY